MVRYLVLDYDKLNLLLFYFQKKLTLSVKKQFLIQTEKAPKNFG